MITTLNAGWTRGLLIAAAAALFVCSAPVSLHPQQKQSRQPESSRSAPRQAAPSAPRPASPAAGAPRTQRVQPGIPSRSYAPPPVQNPRPSESRPAQARPAYPGYAQPGQIRPGSGAQAPSNAQGKTPARPAYQPNAGAASRPVVPPAPAVRPALPGNSLAEPPGHLGSWLNQHSNLPVQTQQKLLQSDPSFKRLPSTDQQRVLNQLQQVDKLPDQERQRRLARAETLERMTPQERTQLNQSSRDLSALPADRQTLVKRAFRDLRAVPLDQRQTVLNSERYRGQFSPQERGILTNLLRAEPYQPE